MQETAPGGGSLYARSVKPRPRVEYANAFVFRPLAHLVVLALMPTRVTPPLVVVTHAVLGVAAGACIAGGAFVAAAVLLQLKTILDNADGQLARARGDITETGRFLDTELDFVSNAAVFWGLGVVTGAGWVAAVAFVILTLVLALDFNVERAYRLERGEPFRPAPDASGEAQALLAVLRAGYALVFAPQDAVIRAFDDARFAAVFRSRPDAERRAAARLAYHDAFTHLVLANFGLSTQLAALGACLVLGAPGAYLALVVAQAVAFAWLQWRRERRALWALEGRAVRLD